MAADQKCAPVGPGAKGEVVELWHNKINKGFRCALMAYLRIDGIGCAQHVASGCSVIGTCTSCLVFSEIGELVDELLFLLFCQVLHLFVIRCQRLELQ